MKAERAWRSAAALALASTLAGLALGCGGIRPQSGAEKPHRVEEAPLGGEALAQRKQDMHRALGDMLAFQATMSSLIDRRDTRGLSVFDGFVAAYMGKHLDPLLLAEWQSSHPEVMTIDANLRFVKADVLVQMRYPRRVQQTIDDIERRYQGRHSMLVDYPIGEQSPLGNALEVIKSRKWEG